MSDDLCQLGQSVVVLAIGQLSVVRMRLMPPFEGGHGVLNYELTYGLDRDSRQLLMRNPCSPHGGSRRVIELDQSLAPGVRVQNSSLTSHEVTLRAELHARSSLRSSGKKGRAHGAMTWCWQAWRRRQLDRAAARVAAYPRPLPDAPVLARRGVVTGPHRADILRC